MKRKIVLIFTENYIVLYDLGKHLECGERHQRTIYIEKWIGENKKAVIDVPEMIEREFQYYDYNSNKTFLKWKKAWIWILKWPTA